MDSGRRKFIQKAGLGSAAGLIGTSGKLHLNKNPELYKNKAIGQALTEPILSIPELKEPVWIASIELLRRKDNFICRVRSKGGVEGISVSNNMQMVYLYPIFLHSYSTLFYSKRMRGILSHC